MRAVLVTIADAANRDGEHATPGITAMVEGSLYGKSHVSRITKRLVEEGWVEVEEQGNGRGRATVYRVVMDRQTPPPVGALETRNPPIPDEKPPHSGRETPPFEDSVPLFPTVTTNGKDPTGGLATVDAVFAAWLASTQKTARTVLDPKRRTLIANALKTHPPEDVLDAVRGWEHSAYHRGDYGKKWNDLGLLLRDAEHIEKFRDLARSPSEPRQVARNGPNPHRPPVIDTDRSGPDRTYEASEL